MPQADIGAGALAIGLVQNVTGLTPRAANFREHEHRVPREEKMHSVLSFLFGAILAASVYGLSFFPSTTLRQDEEATSTVKPTHQQGAHPDSENP